MFVTENDVSVGVGEGEGAVGGVKGQATPASPGAGGSIRVAEGAAALGDGAEEGRRTDGSPVARQAPMASATSSGVALFIVFMSSETG
jgi:hypothetical protein